MRIIDTILGTIRGAPSGVDAATFENLTRAMSRLDEIQRGLAGRIVHFVCTGEGEGHLLTLEQNANAAAQALALSRFYDLKVLQRAALRSLFCDGAGWDTGIMFRLGRVFGATESQFTPTEWGLAGSRKSPMWLRLMATMPQRLRSFGPGGNTYGRFGALTVERCRALLALAGESDTAMLDIAVDDPRGYHYRGDQEEQMRGIGAYLREHVGQASVHAAALDAGKRVALIGLLGRLGLVEAYEEFIFAQAVSSAKTVREAAQAALHGVSRAVVTGRIAKILEAGPPGERVHAVGFAVSLLGEDARPILERQLESEKGKRVRDAIGSALTTLDLVAETPPDSASADSPADGSADEAGSGYTALDGSFVAVPPRPELPPDTALSPAAIAELKRAAANFSTALVAWKSTADLKANLWIKSWAPIGEREIDKHIAFLNGHKPVLGQSRPVQELNRLLKWGTPFDFDKSGVDAFYNHPDTTLWHLLRDQDPDPGRAHQFVSWSLLDRLSRDTQSPSIRRLRQMLDDGLDLRVIMAAWAELDGVDPLRAYLASQWARDLEPWADTGLWHYLAESFDLIDEAFGLKPQSGKWPLHKLAALEVLGAFPKVPKRYLGVLMDLATGTAKTLREPARALLSGAPQIDDAIAALLSDGKQDTRAGAAGWLADRDAADRIPDLRKALKKEKSEIARAAILTALDRLGDDISDQFKEKVLLAEAEKGLAKAKSKALDWFPFDSLPHLKWRDGKPIDPRIVRWWVVLADKLKQPGGNALFDLYLDRLAPEDADRLGMTILRAWIAHDTVAPTEDEANAHARQHADATYKSYRRWMPEVTLDSIFAMLKRDKLSEYLNSAIANKGLLGLSVRAGGAEVAEAARAYLKNHGSRTAQCKALVDCLAGNPSPAAIQVVLATANRFKAKTVQAHAQACIELIAERRGWTPEQLGDRTIPTAGFDEAGRLELDCGFERVYWAQYDAEGKIVLHNPAGKEVKSLPAARNDDEQPLVKAAKKALSDARKEVKQVNTMQVSRLFEAMCTERLWDAGEWQTHLQRHPLVGRLVQRAVWLGLDADGAVVASFRPLADGSLSGPKDETVDPAAFASVKLAHQTLVDDATAASWLEHLSDYEVEPLFPQFGRPLLQLGETQKTETVIDDRKGHMIETFRLRGAATKLGYERGAAQDGGAFMDYTKEFKGLGILVAIEFTGSYLPEENIPAALTGLRFSSLNRRGRGALGTMALGDVPAVLLSESWNDFHQIAAAGTGFDKDWEKKGL